MKNIIYVADSYAKAKLKFDLFVQHCQSNKIEATFSYKNLTIRSTLVTYKFLALEDSYDRIKGLRVDNIVFDELSDIDEDTKCFFKTRLRS